MHLKHPLNLCTFLAKRKITFHVPQTERQSVLEVKNFILIKFSGPLLEVTTLI